MGGQLKASPRGLASNRVTSGRRKKGRVRPVRWGGPGLLEPRTRPRDRGGGYHVHDRHPGLDLDGLAHLPAV